MTIIKNIENRKGGNKNLRELARLTLLNILSVQGVIYTHYKNKQLNKGVMMQEMEQIEKYVGKIHKKFMNVKTTSEDHMTRDLWFSMNVLTMAFNNLDRWSQTTTTPNKAFKNLIKAQLKKYKLKIN